MIVADSDALIDALRGAEPLRGWVERALRGGGLSTTVITTFELLSGARTPEEQAKVEMLLGPLAILPLDQAASRAAASIRRNLEQQGQKIGMADYLIGAICLQQGARLLTRNRAHFERIPGLRLVDWNDA